MIRRIVVLLMSMTLVLIVCSGCAQDFPTNNVDETSVVEDQLERANDDSLMLKEFKRPPICGTNSCRGVKIGRHL